MPTAEEFHDFTRWMVERGRSPYTADLYERHLRHSFEDDRGVLARVSQAGLAPQTRRTNRAALAAWARFAEDDELAGRLAEVKLPPAERVSEKRALELDDWRLLLAELAETDVLDEYERAAISLVSYRGFRIGDVCRLEARSVRQGLKNGLLVYAAKGGRRISWSVTDRMREHLEVFADERGWKHARDLIAPNWNSDRQRGARLRCQRAFARLVAETDLEPEGLSLHIMRRTYAWHYLRFSGGDPVKLQKHMSWRKIDTAMQYVDQQQRSELDAIADSLDAALDDEVE